jgi:hypothetical protein
LQFVITFKPQTLIIASEALGRVAAGRFGRIASRLLFNSLAVAGNENLVLTWFVFLAWEWRMARLGTGVATRFVFSTGLYAGLASILAFSRSMTRASTAMIPALELLAANFPTAYLNKPARLVLELIFATEARFRCEEWAFGAALVI